MPLRDSLSESLPVEAMLKIVRQCAEGEDITLTLAGFTLRLHPERIELRPLVTGADVTLDTRLKFLSTFLLKLSQAWKATAHGTRPLGMAFEIVPTEGANVGIFDAREGIAWLPCDLVAYDPERAAQDPVVTIGHQTAEGPTVLRRIVL